jgi:WD40 repeat protein
MSALEKLTIDSVGRFLLPMSYCLNPGCPQPQNPVAVKFCLSCGTKLLLKHRYRAIQPIGQGGMGRTFLAVDEHRLKARCMIKQFLPAPEIQGNTEAMAKAVNLFEQEAQRLLELGEQHPQIPALLAYFEQDKRLYLVQQLIEGQDLWHELQEQGAFSEAQIIQLLQDLLPVLQFVHENQVIHRDIKPTNLVRRRQDQQLVLIDFGVSKQLTTTSLSSTGMKAGTEGYAPIEQLRSGRAYPASDIYSLGVTCIHLLTDTPLEELFDPLTGQWCWRRILQQRGIEISRSVGQILDKMVKEWVNERYQTAADILQDLQVGVSQVPALSQVPVRQLRWSYPNPKPSAPPTVTRTVSRPPVVDLAQNSAVESRRILTTWRQVHVLTGHSRFVNSVAVSPNSQIIASASSDKTIQLWDLNTGNHLTTFTGHSDDVNSIAFSPDGQLLASSSLDRTIKLWQLATGRLMCTLVGHADWVLSVAFSPDGKMLATGSWDKTIKLINLTTGKLLYTLRGHTDGVRTVAFSPNSKLLISGSWDRTVKLWNVETGKLINTLDGHLDPVSSIAVSPRSLIFATGSEDKMIKLWQLGTDTQFEDRPVRTLSGHSNWVNTLAISWRTQTLASGSRDKTIKLWHIPTGQLVHTLSGESYSVNSVAFSPDGQTLVSGSEDKTVKVWRMTPLGIS